MEAFDRKQHWEQVYQNKPLETVSWYQPVPETSLAYFRQQQIAADAAIIDIGGGDSFLADHLLQLGYKDISVLDISEAAIERAKERLGADAIKIQWIVSDILAFKPSVAYDCWHDRAAFHFLTKDEDIQTYRLLAAAHIKAGGLMIMGTFSENGPKKCSGIDIRQYSVEELKGLFQTDFELIASEQTDHPTPFDTIQHFTFCCFRRREN